MPIKQLLNQMDFPLIIAPMFLVSNPSMALAACSEGVMGSFPAHGTRSSEILDGWLTEMDNGLARLRDQQDKVGPFAVNLVVHGSNDRMAGDLDLIVRHKVPVVLTSKSAPGEAVQRIHDYGGVVLHDIATQRHAEKALEAGVDGLIAVAGGAGGHCGTINPFALINEVRRLHEGILVLAGGMTTGRDVLAAEAMGADFAYIGTRFIATKESDAADGQKRMILDSQATDIFFSASVDGAPANWLTNSLISAGIDLDDLRSTLPNEIVSSNESKKRWKDIWTAGHGVGNIDDIPSTAQLCRRLKVEYFAAQTEFSDRVRNRSARQ